MEAGELCQLIGMKIGFVGLGKMGAGIAGNLIRAGHDVTVYNRTRRKAEALAGKGAHVADSPAATAQGAEAVFSMLANDGAVEEAVFGEAGIAAGLASGTAHISSSTISIAMARRLADEHKKRGQIYISAAVFGRPYSAEDKKLVVVAAGEGKGVRAVPTAI